MLENPWFWSGWISAQEWDPAKGFLRRKRLLAYEFAKGFLIHDPTTGLSGSERTGGNIN